MMVEGGIWEQVIFEAGEKKNKREIILLVRVYAKIVCSRW